MQRFDMRPASSGANENALDANVLRRRFGFESDAARSALSKAADLFCADYSDAVDSFYFWRDLYRSASSPFEREANEDRLPEFDGAPIPSEDRDDALLFLLLSIVAQTLVATVERYFDVSREESAEIFGPTPFDWAAPPRVPQILDDASFDDVRLDSIARSEDPFGRIYAKFFPPKVRRALGEFYTPPPLVELMLDRASEALGPRSELPTTLDPTCGAGVFLTATVRRRIASGATPEAALDSVFGFDLNPFSVLAARANLLFAATASAPDKNRRDTLERLMRARRTARERTGAAPLPVYLFDALRDAVPTSRRARKTPDYFDSLRWAASATGAKRAELALGNPPWIAWDRLAPEYREATARYWREYGLFTLSGTEARYGGVKKELASLFLCATIDRRLADGGTLAFVLPKKLFQSGGSGEGFRRFGAQSCEQTSDGDPADRRAIEPFRALAIDDLSELNLFPSVSTKTVAFYARKGAPTVYPIEVRKYPPSRGALIPKIERALNAAPEIGTARPLNDRPGAPLRFDFPADERAERFAAPAVASANDLEKRDADLRVERLFERATSNGLQRRYVAQLGANAAGGAGVYWLEDRESLDEPLTPVRNLGNVGRRKVEIVDALVESALLYPLLRWRDVDEFDARPTSALILLPQDLRARRGIPLEIMRREYPRALEYLTRFEAFLRERAAYKRYQKRAPFWSLYNADQATVAPYKVVWRRMDSTMRAAVVSPDPKRKRPVAPQDTLSLVPVDSLQEADYLAAALNSAPARKIVDSSSVANAKSFGAPGLLDALPIPIFDPNDPDCLALAEFGRAKREAIRR